MLEPEALVSVAEVSAQGVGTDQSLTEALIMTASEIVTDYCDRPLLYAERTEFPALDGDSRSWSILGQHLRLDAMPVAGVSEVIVAGVTQTVTTVTPSELPISNEPNTVWLHAPWLARGKVFRASGWPPGAISITYTGGYLGPMQDESIDAAEVPMKIRQAVVMTIANLQNLIDRGMDLDLISDRTVAGWAQKWTDKSGKSWEIFPKSARPLLRRYKRGWIR